MGRSVDIRKQEQSFRLYAKTRDVTLVAEEMGVAKSTISKWKKDLGWDEQIRDLAGRLNDLHWVMGQASQNIAFSDMVADLRMLDYLEMQAGRAMLLDGIRPQNWKDVLGTLKFVFDHKAKITNRVAAQKLLKAKQGALEQSHPKDEEEPGEGDSEGPELDPKQLEEASRLLRLATESVPVDGMASLVGSQNGEESASPPPLEEETDKKE